MNPDPNEFIQDGFQVEIALGNDNILINAVELATTKVFTLKLSNNAVNQVSSGTFADINKMYSAFQKAFQKTDQGTRIAINKEGKLDYKINEKVEFSIFLEEKRIDPLVMIQQQMSKMMNNFESKIFEKLKSLEERMTNFEVRKEKKEEKIYLQNNMTFNGMGSLQDDLSEKLNSLEEKIAAYLEKSKNQNKVEKDET